MFSGTPPIDVLSTLSLSDVIGTDTTLVLLKLETIYPLNWHYTISNYISADGGQNIGNGANSGQISYGHPSYALLLSYNGIVYWKASSGGSAGYDVTVSVVFYLNQ